MVYILRNPTTQAEFSREVDTEQEENELLDTIRRMGWEVVRVECE